MRRAFPEVRWAEVETLFLEAAGIPPGAREKFLEQRCAGDHRLREEVLSLLRYDTRREPTLLDALQASAASVVGDDLAAGRMVGPYSIEHEIGRGGMAVVYSAVRADGEFRKRVAIKLIKRGMDTEAVVESLRRERRILAALEHPSIARLLDGGTTPDGRPWIAMEYVEGPADRPLLRRTRPLYSAEMSADR